MQRVRKETGYPLRIRGKWWLASGNGEEGWSNLETEVLFLFFQNSPVFRNKTKPNFGRFKFSRTNLVDSKVELNLLSLTSQKRNPPPPPNVRTWNNCSEDVKHVSFFTRHLYCKKREKTHRIPQHAHVFTHFPYCRITLFKCKMKNYNVNV